jgi:general stress protein 26
MSRVKNELKVDRLVAGAAKAIARVRYCWMITETEANRINARPMGRVLPSANDDDWKIRFVTDGRSRKVTDIRRVGNVGLTFQHGHDDVFVALHGKADLIDRASEVDRLWRPAYDVYFPSEIDRANAAFVEITVERMELWIRDVTPEPFGLRPTVLERDTAGRWHLAGSRPT